MDSRSEISTPAQRGLCVTDREAGRFKAQGFRGSGIQGFWGLGVWGFRGLGFWGFRGLGV